MRRKSLVKLGCIYKLLSISICHIVDDQRQAIVFVLLSSIQLVHVIDSINITSRKLGYFVIRKFPCREFRRNDRRSFSSIATVLSSQNDLITEFLNDDRFICISINIDRSVCSCEVVTCQLRSILCDNRDRVFYKRSFDIKLISINITNPFCSNTPGRQCIQSQLIIMLIRHIIEECINSQIQITTCFFLFCTKRFQITLRSIFPIISSQQVVFTLRYILCKLETRIYITKSVFDVIRCNSYIQRRNFVAIDPIQIVSNTSC